MPRPISKAAPVIILLLIPVIFGLIACSKEDTKPNPAVTTVTPGTYTSSPTPTYLARGASLIVTPNAVEPGGNIEILGAGFLPEEVLTIEIVGALQGKDATLSKDMTTNSYGAFSASYPINSECSSGVYTIRVSGSNGSLVTMPLVIVSERK